MFSSARRREYESFDSTCRRKKGPCARNEPGPSVQPGTGLCGLVKLATLRIAARSFADSDSPILPLRVRVKDQLADLVLRGRVHDRTKQRERSSLAVHRVLARGERDVSAAAASALPNREPDELEPIKRAFGEVRSLDLLVQLFSGPISLKLTMPSGPLLI